MASARLTAPVSHQKRPSQNAAIEIRKRRSPPPRTMRAKARSLSFSSFRGAPLSRSEPFDRLCPMFVHSPHDIVCHTKIERAVLLARKEIDRRNRPSLPPVVMDSGLDASRRPGMTTDSSRVPSPLNPIVIRLTVEFYNLRL
jgi:hypothetical protein